MASAKSTGMDVNSDFTPKDTITSSWPIEYCLSSCKNSELFLTVGSFKVAEARLKQDVLIQHKLDCLYCL